MPRKLSTFSRFHLNRPRRVDSPRGIPSPPFLHSSSTVTTTVVRSSFPFLSRLSSLRNSEGRGSACPTAGWTIGLEGEACYRGNAIQKLNSVAGLSAPLTKIALPKQNVTLTLKNSDSAINETFVIFLTALLFRWIAIIFSRVTLNMENRRAFILSDRANIQDLTNTNPRHFLS